MANKLLGAVMFLGVMLAAPTTGSVWVAPVRTGLHPGVPAAVAPPGAPVYPLKQSANHRYLVDQNDVPFLMAGDSPQALIGNLSEAEAETYLADRQATGFNTVWVNLLCKPYTGCNADGSTFDNIHPFTTTEDLSTPTRRTSRAPTT